MKNLLNLFVAFIFFFPLLANGNPVVQNFITEFQFDSTDWSMEIYYDILSDDDTARWVLVSGQDTAVIKNSALLDTGGNESLHIIRENDLMTPLMLIPDSGTVSLYVLNSRYFTSTFPMGQISWSTSASFNPWELGYSMCLMKNYDYYYDSTPTFGAPNDTSGSMGTLVVTVTDTVNNPIAGALVMSFGYLDAFTDNAGQIRRRLYATSYGLQIDANNFISEYPNVGIRPDSIANLHIVLRSSVSDIQQISSSIPSVFSIEQNAPNPFNATLNFQYSLPQNSNVFVSLFDVAGHRVFTQNLGDQTAGVYRYIKDLSGLSSGVYFYQIQAGKERVSKRCLLLK